MNPALEYSLRLGGRFVSGLGIGVNGRKVETPVIEIAANPNPFSNELWINIEAATDATATLSIMDISGRTIQSQSIRLTEGDNAFVQSDLGALPAGLYLLKVQSNAGVWVEKLVKG